MLLHYGFTHAQPSVLAGVALLTFAAGLLLGTWTTDDAAESDPVADPGQ